MFPSGLTLDETLESFKGMSEFKLFKNKGYTFIKYERCDNTTFPDISTAKNDKEKRLLQVRRECRGVTFDSTTGKCVARRFHKFFNINEKEETNQERIDFNRPFYLVEKLDGSLVSPLLVENEVLFCSMSGFTEFTTTITTFMKDNQDIKYKEFCQFILSQGKTPLFEWCSATTPVVIRHEKDALILLNVRDIETGNYVKYDDFKKIADEYHVPVTSIIRDVSKNPKELLEEVYNKKMTEGYVIVFEDGDMYKAKTHFYNCAHGISPNSKFLNDRFLLKSICLDVIDDVIATLPFSLDKREKIQKWRDHAQLSMKNKAKLVESSEAVSDMDKMFLEFASKYKESSPIDIMTRFVLDIAGDFMTYKKYRFDMLNWFQIEEVKEEKKGIEKIDKFYRENDVDIYADEDDEEELVETDLTELIKIGDVKPNVVAMCPKHKIPLEYCEFKQDWSDCRLVMISKYPELLKKIEAAKEKDPVRKQPEKKKETKNDKKENKK